MPHERPSEQRNIDWGKVIETALTAPGNMHGVYDRFYSYSYFNIMYLRLQGVAEPVATMKRWNAIGRTVLKGSRAKEIIIPLFAKRTKEDGEQEPIVTGFKPVRCIFTLSETEGEELPPMELPEWDESTALERLGIRRVPFTELNGNIQGVSRGKDVAINPVAVNPKKTLAHELGHVVLGHTVPNTFGEYIGHRCILEFQAEATAYLTLNELERLDERTATVSRAYIRSWLEGERPPDRAIRQVFGAVDTIIKAGRLAISPPMNS